MIATHVKRMIATIARVDPRMRDEATLEDLGMDSLDLGGLAGLLESEYRITISDDEASKWRTVTDVIAFVQKRTDI